MAQSPLKTAGAGPLRGRDPVRPGADRRRGALPRLQRLWEPTSATSAPTAARPARSSSPRQPIFDVSVFLLGLAGLAGGLPDLHQPLPVGRPPRHPRGPRRHGRRGLPGDHGRAARPGLVRRVLLHRACRASPRTGSCGPPFSYFSAVLGVVTLVALVLYASGIYLGLGPGGWRGWSPIPAVCLGHWRSGANLMGIYTSAKQGHNPYYSTLECLLSARTTKTLPLSFVSKLKNASNVFTFRDFILLPGTERGRAP